MERRELFKILAVTGAAAPQLEAQHHHGAAAASPANYKPRFLTPAEYEAIDRLCETILPADNESAGAHAAGVPVYIDTMALHSRAPGMKEGLAEVERLATERFGKPVAGLTTTELAALAGALLANEQAPQSSLDRFALRLKALTIEGFSVSEVGMKHFGYKGNRGVAEFRGCTHPDHQPE
jgi:hypothetical protein